MATLRTAWQHPWLRVQRLIRWILEVRRDPVTRPVMKATLTKALREREKIRRAVELMAAARRDRQAGVSIFPEQLRIGARSTNEDGAWEVAHRPVTCNQGQ